MDPFRYTTLAHAGREWLGPVSPARFDALLDELPHPPGRVLDVGCGKGAMLAHLLARFPAAGAIGVEPNPAFAADARAAFERAGVSDRATLLVQPLERVGLPGRAFDLVVCAGATHAFGTTRDALLGAGALARPGGHVLIGEGHWRRTPDPGYLAVLGCDEDAHVGFRETVALGLAAGLEPIASSESSLAEWDAYEDAYARAVRGWAAANPGDPDAVAFRERIDHWTDGRARWGRETLGFALHLHRVPEEP